MLYFIIWIFMALFLGNGLGAMHRGTDDYLVPLLISAILFVYGVRMAGERHRVR